MLNVVMRIIGSLPLPLLYALSSGLAVAVHRVARYRLGVVRRNLATSFPEKSREELRRIERDFYRFLCDYAVETLHMAAMSPEKMRKHMVFSNVEAVNDCIAQGRDVSLFLGHYCNWEWVSSMPLWLSPEAVGVQIYKPLRSKSVDSAFLGLRNRFGAMSVKKHATLRTLLTLRREGRRTVTGYISDQIPGYGPVSLWLPFLNHDTAVFCGAERIGKKLGSSLFYCRLSRPERGRYVCTFLPVSDDLSHEPDFEPTRRCFALLEEDIRREPHLWLWSHRRWKRKHDRAHAD